MKLCLLVCVIISIQRTVADYKCKKALNDSFGHLNITYNDMFDPICTWTIGKVGITNAVALFIIQRINLVSCSEHLKIFDGNKTLKYQQTRHTFIDDEQMVEVPFLSSDEITVNISLTRLESSVKAQYVILGSGLLSAPTFPGWNCTIGNNTSSRISVQWTDLTVLLNRQVRHFLVFLKLKENIGSYSAHKLVNGSELGTEITGLMASSSYTVVVFGIDKMGKPYKTNDVQTRTMNAPCGERPTSSTRIVGGTVAPINDWPWQTMLRRTGGGQFCGGSLIRPEWVLTAAHCIEGESPSSIEVTLGAHYISRDTVVGTEQYFDVVQIIQHQHYSSLNNSNDMALLRLSKPAKLRNGVGLVCLSDDKFLLPFDDEDKKCWITGWGTLYYLGPQPKELMQVEIPLVSRENCSYSYPGHVDDTMICAGRSQGGIDTCQGDSGGPLVCEFNGKWYLEGVTSWGVGCAEAGQPGVYADVRYFKSWIINNMNNPPLPKHCSSVENNTLRSPGYPGFYPSDIDCVYRVPIPCDKELVIYFNYFHLEGALSCSYDYLRITDGSNRVIGTYCGQQTGRSVPVNDTVAVLLFHTDGSVEYDGFHLSFSFFPLGNVTLPSYNPLGSSTTQRPSTNQALSCGSVQNNTVRSPGYPNNYPSFLDCVYEVPIPFDQELVIYFNFFHLESHPTCGYDYLRITNSSNHTIGTYCGFQTGRGVLITGSAAVLYFHTDFSVEYSGFDLSFSFYPRGNATLPPYTPLGSSTTQRPITTPASNCASVQNNTLRSPGYPNNYPSYLDCVYEVPIPFDQELLIYFNFFHLESHPTCGYDYLRITNSSNHTIGTYCGFQTGRGVLITGSAAVLYFHTDFIVEYSGFDLSFSFYPRGNATLPPYTTLGSPTTQRPSPTPPRSCGGTFNQSFGRVIIEKLDWYDQTCSWEINNMGLPNAVLLISVQDLRFYNCGHEYVRVFSDDQEFANFRECSHLQGELVVAPFGHSNNITSEIRIQHLGSFMRTQFVVLKGGLDTAASLPTSWDISLSNKTASSLTIDWSGFSVNLVASFFVISLNQTPRAVSQDGNPNEPMNFLSIVANSSQTVEVVNGLPAFSEFVATVYLVDINNDIYKSNTLVVETEESVPSEAPYLFIWNADWAENSVSFWISPIEERYHGGRLLGYQITYFQFGKEDEKMVVQVGPNQQRASLGNLTEGMTYQVFASGFTSKGVGPNSTYTITLCGGDLQTQMGQFSSPNYPQTPYLPPDQWELIPRCHWRLRPQAPNVSVITLTFLNFFLGRRGYEGYCSGGAIIYVTGQHEHDRSEPTYICGKETNSSFLIMAKNADIEAWGFKYHWYSEQFRQNNGTKFLAHFKASPAEYVFGQTLHFWTGVHFNVTNVSALMTWSEPPSGFISGSTVQKYLLIEGKHPTKIFHFIPLPHSGRQMLLEGLEVLTNYTGRIIAILSDGRRGSTDWLEFQTKEGIPSRNPYIYDAESIDYSTIWIRWRELQKTEIGGILRGYRIHITRAYHYGGYQPFYKSITVGPNVTEYNITDLPSETEFLVWVAAFTAVGEGIQRNDRWIKTKCGSTLSNSSGSLQSRGYPERMLKSDCVWYIHAMEKTVFIWVQHYDIPYSHECRDAYVAIGDDSGIPPDRHCGVSGEAFALAQAQKVPLIYYSDRYFEGSGKGFELSYYVLDESFSEATVVAEWNIVNISDVKRRSINVVWNHYSPDHPYQLVIYAVVCTPTSGKAGSTVFNVDKYNDRADVGRLHTGTNYTVEIVALVNNNQTGEVSLRKSQKAYVTTVEGIPLEPPEWIDLEVYLNNTLKIYVKWPAIPSHRVEGKLLGYKVYYRVDGDDEFSSLTVGPNVHETTIDIANLPSPYEIRVAGFTKGGIGPMSWPRERLGCQATAVSQMGVITSPGFPESTPGGMNCFNAFYPTFTPPVQRFLLVHVVDLLTNRRVEGAPNCTYWQDDYLRWATINPTVILAGPFCGKVQPFAFVSWGNFARPLYMGFFTGSGTHEREFNSTFFALHDFSKINISFISVSGHDAQLSWSASGVEDQIQGCVVLYKKTQVRKPLWSFKRTLQQNQTSLVSLLPLTNYTAWVLCYTSTGKVYGSNTIHFVTIGALPTTSPEGISPTPPPVIRMYPYGESAGDTELSFTNRCPRINVPGGGIRFFSTRFRELYICPYGTIQFEIDRFNLRPYNFGQRYWLRFSSMIAPYWTRTDLGRSFINGPSKVFYHIYTGPNDTEILKNATSDVLQSESGSSLPEGKTFNATWVLVVTWVKLRHLQLNPIAENLTNTFQAVLITDNIFTFVMFNYPHNGIQFSVPTSVSLYEYFSASSASISLPVIGFNSGGSKNHYLNLPRSGTLRAEGIDNAIGNVGIPGRWILRIENSSGIEDSDFNCSLWYNNQPDPVRGSLIDRPDPCPCTVLQAFIDNRYTWVEPYFPFTECFYTVQPVNERGRRCCYYKDAERRGALILDSQPQAGTLDRYHKLRFPEKHQKHDLEAFGYCCLTSRRRVESCKKYYEKRPSKGCRAYVPPQRAPVFGDPHLVTLDGKNYTFNGLGEYVMINVEKSFFQLQARTKLAKGGGTATVFAAAVAKEENTSTLQCTLMEEGGLEVLINGQIFQEFHSLTNVSFLLNDSVAVSRPQNNSFLVTFPSGISVTVTEIQDSLSIVFAAPSSFQGQTKGLLGSWNGDQQDDFLKPDGTILPSNATGREIHFNFGLEWQLTDNITLFTYNPGENTSTFSNASFVPIFLDEPIDFGSDELRTAAELACHGDVNCLFDIASTGDVSVGASTKEVSVQIESESQALANFPPEILVGPTEVNVTVNTSATITITAQDPNNDSLIFSVAGNLPAGHTTSTNQTSITISWTVTTAQIEVEFIASDGTANTVHSPIINVCACQNQGVCVQESSDESNLNNNTEKFTFLFCNCLNGYTGSFCEADLDACDENFQPCFPGVSCIDSPPPANASGYTCGPCPSGYSGDGAECSDIDECDTNNGGCDHNCVNTPGSSVCTCNSGYFLNFDGKSCEDVDECQSVSNCMQICENTNGSYNCKCHADFEVDPEDPKNCIPANPCQDNQPGCQHVCYQSDGQENCSCYAGFSLNQDGKTCSDIDECTSSQPPCSQNCSNTNGSYTCSCVTGFILDSNGQTCSDIDECLEFTFQCQDESQKCENTYGSYKCICEEGLYWIDNKCQGLDKGEAPPPPPPAPEPKQPSEEERIESVNIDIQGLNTSEWNKPKEDAFKQSVAEAATIQCANDNNCISSSSKRKRRSLNNLIFTEDQVHLLPGYPKQVSQVPLVAIIAFYLQTPPGSSSSVINKNVLVTIVKSSVAEISSALNANISNVQLFDNATTTAQTPEPASATTTAPTSATISATTSPTTNTSTETTTVPAEEEVPNTMLYAIIAGVVGALVFVIVVSLIVWWLCRGKKREKSLRGEEKNDALGLEMGRVKRIDNIGYYNDAYALPPKVHLERQ